MQVEIVPPTLNSLAALNQSIDHLFITVNPVLVPLARAWGYPFCCVDFLYCCYKGAGYALRGSPAESVPDFMAWVGRVIFVNVVLTFYDRAIPGFGVSFPDLFSVMGNQIAALIQLAGIDELLGQINDCIQGIEHPPLWSPAALVVYFLVMILMAGLNLVLFIVTSMGFWMLGLGKVFGSILTTFIFLPFLRHKFFNWCNFMFVYSMYRPMAAAVVFIASEFLVNLFQNTINGQYDLGHLSGILAYLLASVVAVSVLLLKTPHTTVELMGTQVGHAGGDAGYTWRGLVLAAITK